MFRRAPECPFRLRRHLAFMIDDGAKRSAHSTRSVLYLSTAEGLDPKTLRIAPNEWRAIHRGGEAMRWLPPPCENRYHFGDRSRHHILSWAEGHSARELVEVLPSKFHSSCSRFYKRVPLAEGTQLTRPPALMRPSISGRLEDIVLELAAVLLVGAQVVPLAAAWVAGAALPSEVARPA
jgi:hypothetical protein